MKWIIYTLLLTNLAFGLWHYRSVELTNQQAPVDEDNLRLVLLKEYRVQQEQVGKNLLQKNFPNPAVIPWDHLKIKKPPIPFAANWYHSVLKQSAE